VDLPQNLAAESLSVQDIYQTGLIQAERILLTNLQILLLQRVRA
jgi:hypothetical protein